MYPIFGEHQLRERLQNHIIALLQRPDQFEKWMRDQQPQRLLVNMREQSTPIDVFLSDNGFELRCWQPMILRVNASPLVETLIGFDPPPWVARFLSVFSERRLDDDGQATLPVNVKDTYEFFALATGQIWQPSCDTFAPAPTVRCDGCQKPVTRAELGTDDVNELLCHACHAWGQTLIALRNKFKDPRKSEYDVEPFSPE